ncbi:MAG: tRNA pseudouridine(55) synthase TruB [candidate division KSB1 bacterium]|nr:tRNA pseudouridine(55) synthase TruB [candidate division KSB1 bacterium]MDZ7346322.1 tRNA pseudouridine(55) synthase TruB [candidate division KSB1 bacterium]
MKRPLERTKAGSFSSAGAAEDGTVLNLCKPIGWTSNDVVRRAKRLLGVEKIGHAGTLDPLADGVLLLGVGREGTRRIAELMGMEKEYRLLMELGVETDTLDLSGKIVQRKVPASLDRDLLQQTLQRFVGVIEQTPPAFSAVHVAGRRAYQLARSGVPFELPKRWVTIYALELLESAWPRLHLRAVCSKGVYIRSLVRDLAYALGEIGYLKRLTRTRIGPFKIEDALSIEALESQYRSGSRV